MLSSVMAHTIGLIRSLRLHSVKARERSCPDPAVKGQVETALRLLYSLDRRNTLRWDTFSVSW